MSDAFSPIPDLCCRDLVAVAVAARIQRKRSPYRCSAVRESGGTDGRERPGILDDVTTAGGVKRIYPVIPSDPRGSASFEDQLTATSSISATKRFQLDNSLTGP